jgi:L-fuculose-phosphate aldolase
VDLTTAREECVAFGRRIAAHGLVVGPGGNLSVRVGDEIVVKASGVAFEEAGPDDYVAVNLADGRCDSEARKPTCEVLMHRKCYELRADVGAVAHTHSPFATGVASSGQPLKAAGMELARALGGVIGSANAVLLANHGVVAVGVNLREAFYRVLLIEEAAKSLVAASAVGTPRFLTDKEIEEIRQLGAEKYRIGLIRNRE